MRAKIEVGDEQPVGLGNPVRQRHDDMGGGGESRLAHQADRAACARPTRRARARASYSRKVSVRKRVCASNRSVPRSPVAPPSASSMSSVKRSSRCDWRRSSIVEADHLGNQSWPQPERQTALVCAVPRPDAPLSAAACAAACAMLSRSSAPSRRGEREASRMQEARVAAVARGTTSRVVRRRSSARRSTSGAAGARRRSVGTTTRVRRGAATPHNGRRSTDGMRAGRERERARVRLGVITVRARAASAWSRFRRALCAPASASRPPPTRRPRRVRDWPRAPPRAGCARRCRPAGPR